MPKSYMKERNDMKITKMRIKGQKPTHEQMIDIELALRARFARAGFITGVHLVNSARIDIGQHMRSFSLDTSKHDRNLQCSPYKERLTNLPTWGQRVEFNNIVNSVLNKYKVSANVKSGPYTIRQGMESMTEKDWHRQTPDWIRQNMARGYYIEPVDEKDYLEHRRQIRNEKARQKRLTKSVEPIKLAVVK